MCLHVLDGRWQRNQIVSRDSTSASDPTFQVGTAARLQALRQTKASGRGKEKVQGCAQSTSPR
jgi:hypothetical protein